MSTDLNPGLHAEQRQEAIVQAARTDGRVEVSMLAEQLGVTSETVRRDLTLLERRGKVRRVHGGALPVHQTEREPTIFARLGRWTQEKERIAARAVAELPAEGTVLLDAGTTTLALARLFPVNSGLSVVTNSVAIAAVLNDRDDVPVHVLGGRIRERTGATVGVWTLEALKGICVDVAFLGTNGFAAGRGLTTPDQAEAAVKRAMVAAAKVVIVVSDSSKAGQAHFHRFAETSDIDKLITDTGLDDETAELFDQAGMEVIRT